MSKALGLLKRARGTRGYLYEQPWYAIIGPPGAGKTTALLNSGLNFPLAAEMGQGAVAGVGGTRLCDWWFTENAVLIMVEWVAAPMLAFPVSTVGFPIYRTISQLLHLAILGAWIFMLIKVSHDQDYHLPVLGDLADRSVSEQRP